MDLDKEVSILGENGEVKGVITLRDILYLYAKLTDGMGSLFC